MLEFYSDPPGRGVSVEQVRPDCGPRLRERRDGKHHRHAARRAGAADRPRAAGPRATTSESVIAHELFHQWFGDYVTAESWSNITVNESMADFSEGAVRRAQVRPATRPMPTTTATCAGLPGQPARRHQEPGALPLQQPARTCLTW
ncbi:MAG: M1 family aminopeptidase [Hymenobacter sp.]